MILHIAAQINSFLAALVLLTAFGMLVQKRIYGLIHRVCRQGLFLSLNTAVVGFVASKHHLYISSVLTLSLKVVLLPYILHVLINRLRIRKEVETVVNIPMTMMIGIALVIFSYHLTAPHQGTLNAYYTVNSCDRSCDGHDRTSHDDHPKTQDRRQVFLEGCLDFCLILLPQGDAANR